MGLGGGCGFEMIVACELGGVALMLVEVCVLGVCAWCGRFGLWCSCGFGVVWLWCSDGFGVGLLWRWRGVGVVRVFFFTERYFFRKVGSLGTRWVKIARVNEGHFTKQLAVFFLKMKTD